MQMSEKPKKLSFNLDLSKLHSEP